MRNECTLGFVGSNEFLRINTKIGIRGWWIHESYHTINRKIWKERTFNYNVYIVCANININEFMHCSIICYNRLYTITIF